MSNKGFKRLPGGSYSDCGERIGASSVGDLASSAFTSLVPPSIKGQMAAALQARSIWQKMPHTYRQHVQNVVVRELRVNRELIVFCDSSAWLYELNMYKNAIIIQWNAICDQTHTDLQVKTASFKLSKKAFDRGEDRALTRPLCSQSAPVPLTPSESAYVSDLTARITDDGLKKSVQKAMTATLEWKKSKTNS